MTDFTRLDYCLACGLPNLVPYFVGGTHPPANAFYKPGEPEPASYPLGLQFCPICWHSQNLVAVDPKILYTDYAYASGTSRTLSDWFSYFVGCAEKAHGNTGKNLRVLDIACNDGSLLKKFAARGHKVQGVDPASNLNDGSVPILNTYWDEQAIRMLPTNGGVEPYDVIVMMNVLGHVSDPLTFLTAAKHVLAPGGRIYVQTSQATMVEDGMIDTVYHEHLSFFTVRSFQTLAKRAGLHIRDITHVPVHGTSYLVEMVSDENMKPVGGFTLATDEQAKGYYSRRLYDAFTPRVQQHVEHVKNTLRVLEDQGYIPILYGAAAKAITYAAYAGLKFVLAIDDAPLKQDKIIPGLAVRVFPLSDLDGEPLDKAVWVIGAWNMKAEIIGKIKKARPTADDKFLTYYPSVVVE